MFKKYYVVFANDNGILKCVEVKARESFLACDQVRQAYGGWVDTMAFENPPVSRLLSRIDILIIRDGKLVFNHPDLTESVIEQEAYALEFDAELYLECMNNRPFSVRVSEDDQRQGLILFHHVYKGIKREK